MNSLSELRKPSKELIELTQRANELTELAQKALQRVDRPNPGSLNEVRNFPREFIFVQAADRTCSCIDDIKTLDLAMKSPNSHIPGSCRMDDNFWREPT